MKNLNIFILLILIVGVISGCADNSNNSSGNSNEENYDSYPEKPIEFIVQYGAGGATDLVFRPVLTRMEKELGATILVQNITEGGGIQGAKKLADAKPDGYTAGVLSAGQTIMAPLFREVPVGLEDYEVVGSVGSYLYGIIAPVDAPYDDFEGFISFLEDNKGKLIASTIPSNVYEIFYTWLRNNYDVEFSTLPFDSATDTSLAVQNGSADFSVGLTSVDNARLESGEIKLIAPLGDMRWPVEPNIPTMQEQGYPEVMVATILGIGLPKDTPEPIREKWEAALKTTLEDPQIIDILKNLSTEPAFKSGDDFGDYLKELDKSFKGMTGK